MTPLILTVALMVILLGMMIWLQFTPKKNQIYFKIGAGLVLILFVWIAKDHGKIYYSTLISILALNIVYKEYVSLKKPV
jgi:hypothetical protein